MKKITDLPEIKKVKKAYDKAVDAIYVCEQKSDKEMSKAGCWECKIFHSKYEGKEMELRFSSCAGCKHEKSLLAVKTETLDASKKADKLHKEYAKAVFDILSKEKPKLYSRIERKNVEWETAFSADFDKVPEVLYVALVALAEDDIGRYSFAK